MNPIANTPPILEAVKRFILDWAAKVNDPYEIMKKGNKIPESTIARMLDPQEVPTEKTLLGFNAIHFEEVTGHSIYEFVIAQAKIGLWGAVDHLPEIKTHKDLVSALSKVYKEDPEERFKLLSVRAEFGSRRDLNDVLSGRPLFWRKIPGVLEFVAKHTKGIEPKGSPRCESAFEKVKEVGEPASGVPIESMGIGHAVTCVISIANMINSLHIVQADITQVQRLGLVSAMVRIAQKFGITPSSLERAQSGDTGGAAVDALMTAFGNKQRTTRR